MDAFLWELQPNPSLIPNLPSVVGYNAVLLKMTELNYAFISENGKELEKTLDWSYIEWNEKENVKGTDAQTQTQRGPTEDKETQTSNPFIMRIDLGRTPTRPRYGSVAEAEGLSTNFFQFDRQAPARISTSPTLRRMRSTRLPYRDQSRFDGILGEESPSPRSPLSPSPLTVKSDGETGSFETSMKVRSHRAKTLDNGVICKNQGSHDSKEIDSDDNAESSTDDSDQVQAYMSSSFTYHISNNRSRIII